MAYEHKPGSFSLFKNTKKEKETQPDYTGSGTDTNGVECTISAWVKRPEGKSPFFSISIQAKQQPEVPAAPAPVQQAKVVGKVDDLPF